MTAPSRRLFMSGLLAAAPALTLARLEAQPAATNDPVWSLIMADLQRIYGELSSDGVRRDSLRALESTLRTYAAYSASLGNPQRLQRTLAARLRTNKLTFLEEARRMSSHQHRDAELGRLLPNYQRRFPNRAEPTLDELDRAAASIARNGHISALIAAANLARALAERQPQIARVRFELQTDLCDQLQSQIAALTFLAGVVCAATIVNPALGPECAALGATLAVMEMTYFLSCSWI